MKKGLFAYAGTLLAFLVLDGLWLGVLMAPTYRALLGPLMLDQPLLAPAAVFYLLYVLGCVVFVVLPAAPEHRAQELQIVIAASCFLLNQLIKTTSSLKQRLSTRPANINYQLVITAVS